MVSVNRYFVLTRHLHVKLYKNELEILVCTRGGGFETWLVKIISEVNILVFSHTSVRKIDICFSHTREEVKSNLIHFAAANGIRTRDLSHNRQRP